jgi:Flp pilus assembly protein TadD
MRDSQQPGDALSRLFWGRGVYNRLHVLARTLRPLTVILLLTCGLRPASAADPRPEAALEAALSAGETHLRNGEREVAERDYRAALLEGWRLIGWLEMADGRAPEAEAAFSRSSGERQGPDPARKTMPNPLEDLTAPDRSALRRRVTSALAQTYLNLGIMEAQRERFAAAADLLETAATLDAEFPQVQYALGVAHYNARSFEKAKAPIQRALAGKPGDASLRRMLAMVCLNTQDYDQAVSLLQNDGERERDPSLQYAYGLALVRSNRAAEAQSIFAKLVAEHGDSAEVNVILGQAHAQQGDYDSAILTLRRALQRKPDVAEANGALGVIYLKQGRLAEAEAALRAELRVRPADLQSESNLATVLDLENRSDEAVVLLRAVLEAKPAFKDARYLLGKLLLAKGEATEAIEHLEAAARIAPDDANIRYQLGKAYQKLGRQAEAQHEFEAFRTLKDKRRGTP